MAAGAQPRTSARRIQRRIRFLVQAPLDVTVLRQGIPHTFPGRSVNLCEHGLAAVLSGEVLPGEAVGLELQLPAVAEPFRTRAIVRHHDRLSCGMEFIGLTAEHQTFLRKWVEQSKATPERPSAKESPESSHVVRPNKTVDLPILASQPERFAPQPATILRRWGWITSLLLITALALGTLWWRWERGWNEIESSPDTAGSAAEQPQTQVPAEVMEKLITHRVDPEYPEAARQARLQGIVILDVVVGQDGSVISVRPVNGPEVLTKAATDALRWWRFQPYRVEGKPTTVETTVAVEFNP